MVRRCLPAFSQSMKRLALLGRLLSAAPLINPAFAAGSLAALGATSYRLLVSVAVTSLLATISLRSCNSPLPQPTSRRNQRQPSAAS